MICFNPAESTPFRRNAVTADATSFCRVCALCSGLYRAIAIDLPVVIPLKAGLGRDERRFANLADRRRLVETHRSHTNAHVLVKGHFGKRIAPFALREEVDRRPVPGICPR